MTKHLIVTTDASVDQTTTVLRELFPDRDPYQPVRGGAMTQVTVADDEIGLVIRALRKRGCKASEG
jgi:hypothetical protein